MRFLHLSTSPPAARPLNNEEHKEGVRGDGHLLERSEHELVRPVENISTPERIVSVAVWDWRRVALTT